MPAMKSFFARLLGAVSRLSDIEKMVLDWVRDHPDTRIAKLWDSQMQAINKVQRLPEGVEVNFYRMKSGRPSFDEGLAFPNKTTELLVNPGPNYEYDIQCNPTRTIQASKVMGFNAKSA